MPDIAAVGSVLASVKTATEIVKLLRESDASLASAETKLQLAELVHALADAKLEIAGIQELLLEKDSFIRELKEQSETHQNLNWEDPVYYLQTDQGKEGPFCPQCYDSDRKSIRLQTSEPGSWHCLTCEKSFHSQGFLASRNRQVESDYDPFA